MRVVASLRGRKEFASFRSSRTRVRRESLTVIYVKGSSESVRVAYAISRKVGGAVVRNRLRRRLRAICSQEEIAMVSGNYMITVKPNAADLSFVELRDQVQKAMAQIVERQS